jgi:signal peptidase II
MTKNSRSAFSDALKAGRMKSTKKPEHPRPSTRPTDWRDLLRRVRLLFAAAAPVLAADQWTKAWVLSTIPPQPETGLHLYEPYALTVIKGFLAFIHTRNTGSAFSLFSRHPEILTALAVALSVVVLFWALFLLPGRDKLGRVAMGLILGGAVGNLADRFLRQFEVTDFILILIQYKGRYWPTFNVADMAICVGIGLFFIASLKEAIKERREARAL